MSFYVIGLVSKNKGSDGRVKSRDFFSKQNVNRKDCVKKVGSSKPLWRDKQKRAQLSISNEITLLRIQKPN